MSLDALTIRTHRCWEGVEGGQLGTVGKFVGAVEAVEVGIRKHGFNCHAKLGAWKVSQYDSVAHIEAGLPSLWTQITDMLVSNYLAG